MSKRHKNGKHQSNERTRSQAQQVSQYIAEVERYDRDNVINWCLDWMEYFRVHGDMEESAIAFDWADWCEKAPTNLFNQVCDQWAAWTAQQSHNRSIKQGELL